MKKQIEVELRGLLTKKGYDALRERLSREGVAREHDDKDTYFFNVPSGILKICDERSKNRAKISVKTGSEETGALRETEVLLNRGQISALLECFLALGYAEYHLVPQKRTNYFLDGAILSLKHTPDFQHHFEMEGELLEDDRLIEAEKRKLRAICGQYGLVPMEPGEIAAQIKNIRQRIGFER